MYKRYYIADLPGLGWTADYSTTLMVHYFAAMVLFFAVTFHLVFHVQFSTINGCADMSTAQGRSRLP